MAADHKWKAFGQSKFNTGKYVYSPLKTIIMKNNFYQIEMLWSTANYSLRTHLQYFYKTPF